MLQPEYRKNKSAFDHSSTERRHRSCTSFARAEALKNRPRNPTEKWKHKLHEFSLIFSCGIYESVQQEAAAQSFSQPNSARASSWHAAISGVPLQCEERLIFPPGKPHLPLPIAGWPHCLRVVFAIVLHLGSAPRSHTGFPFFSQGPPSPRLSLSQSYSTVYCISTISIQCPISSPRARHFSPGRATRPWDTTHHGGANVRHTARSRCPFTAHTADHTALLLHYTPIYSDSYILTA